MLMKKIIGIILGLIMCISFTSCSTIAYAETNEGLIDTKVIITYGTPYYNNDGLLLYYIYRDLFYYPYYYNGWHFRHYRRPLPLSSYRPLPRDFYRHTPRHYYHARPQYRYNKPSTVHYGNYGRLNTHHSRGITHTRHGHFSRGR